MVLLLRQSEASRARPKVFIVRNQNVPALLARNSNYWVFGICQHDITQTNQRMASRQHTLTDRIGNVLIRKERDYFAIHLGRKRSVVGLSKIDVFFSQLWVL